VTVQKRTATNGSVGKSLTPNHYWLGFHQLAMNYANYMTYQRNSAFESQLAAITLRGKDNFEKQMPSVEFM